MVEFSADAERRALEPWTIEIEGRVHTAAPVSRPALLAFLAVVKRHEAGTATLEESEGALYRLLRTAFPRRRWAYWWHGDPVLQILGLDWRVRERVLASFFESLGLHAPPSAPGMNGTSDSPPSSVDGNGSRPAPSAREAGAASRLA